MNKKMLTVIIGTVLTLSIAACGTKEDDSTAAPQTANGGAAETIYQQSCASCHGNNLQGKMGPALINVGGKYSQEDIQHIIENGRGGMPPGLVKGEDATKVAEWLAEKK